MCAGGVLFLDGLAIFNYHREEIRNYFDGESNINLGCSDTRIGIPLNVAIHNQGNYIPVEFAGVVITVAAYVSSTYYITIYRQVAIYILL